MLGLDLIAALVVLFGAAFFVYLLVRIRYKKAGPDELFQLPRRHVCDVAPPGQHLVDALFRLVEPADAEPGLGVLDHER